jgi:hypothetical protein
LGEGGGNGEECKDAGIKEAYPEHSFFHVVKLLEVGRFFETGFHFLSGL